MAALSNFERPMIGRKNARQRMKTKSLALLYTTWGGRFKLIAQTQLAGMSEFVGSENQCVKHFSSNKHHRIHMMTLSSKYQFAITIAGSHLDLSHNLAYALQPFKECIHICSNMKYNTAMLIDAYSHEKK